MVSSAIFGAAAGTGLALVVGMTIVVYRYYAVKRKGKYWSSLDRWPDPPSTKRPETRQEECSEHCHDASSSHVLNCWRKQQKNYYAVQTREFNVAKEQHAVQPCSSVVVESGSLPHQSRSYPGGSGGSGSMGRLFTRNSSVSSQSSLEGASGPSSHRGSSTQVRSFGPDGRYHHHRDPLHAASSYPPSKSSRSPSPGRAASLDARCGSPASCSGSLLSSNASPSQSSLSSLATGVSSSCGGSSISVAHGVSRSAGRSLSPLLIPPSRISGSDGGPPPPASPLGSIQPDLYQRRDGPIHLKARGNGKSLGRLHLRFKYDFDRSDLHVHLIEAHDLAGSDQGGFNDPYVKLTLSPEVDSRKRQTQIYRNESNPFFDQQFKFPVSNDELQDKTLVLQVLDYDRFSRNNIVGSVKVPLHILRLDSPTSTEEVWGEIECEPKPREQIQEVLLSLSYLPSAERLTVVILRARNLFPPQDKETLDSFVKVNLLCREKRVKKKKTAVRKATTSPVWNEALSFDVPSNYLESSAIEVCVMDSSNEFMGGNVMVGSCIVGPAIRGLEGSGNKGREHWQHITQSPRKTIAMWHTLH
ncbi:PREDICTED: synaptotagmin-5 [Eufriesea mexicana]|uniref:synaptotagmin-5 n=1 Tax=Eufriesea mexicana TaxID=516756 RepID=UPI00083C4D39|nr:PREDICTED: synaptotagmin-5 [Eufriesea mexicana]XP_017754709.1 PREDICTED: synaptotagmin-5 [Eufriesea mexicana]XP_017754710.1 PREDICTED: synaptotagmin-5 [Eufriesea mexicana]